MSQPLTSRFTFCYDVDRELQVVANGVGAEFLKEAAGIVVHAELGPADGSNAFHPQPVVGQALQRNGKLYGLGNAFEGKLAGGSAAAHFAQQA